MKNTIAARGRWLPALGLAALVVGCGGSDSARVDAIASPACAAPTADGWCQVQPVGRAEVIESVDFVDSRHGWMAGRDGAMLRTTDGSVNWETVAFPVRDRIRQVVFIDSNRGWALATEIWHSEDGGRTWAKDGSAPMTYAHSIKAAGPGRLVLVGCTPEYCANTRSAISEDGGRTWRTSALPVVVVEANGRLWGGEYGRLQGRSDDGGRSFFAEPALQAQPNCSVYRFSVEADGWAYCALETGFGATKQYRLLQRPGFEAPWRLAPAAPMAYSLWAQARLDARGGLAVTDSSLLWRTTDAAQSWQAVALPAEWERFDRFGLTPPPPMPANTLPSSQFGFLDSQSLWVLRRSGVGEESRPLHLSFDGGATWSTNAHPTPRRMMNFVHTLARDRSGALLIGYGAGARWFRSSDNGASWRALPLAVGNQRSERIAGFLGPDDLGRSLAISYTGELFDSTDVGRTWQRRAEAEQLPGFAAEYPSWGWGAPAEDSRTDPQIVSGGGNTVWAINDSRLFRSQDRGRRFDEIVLSFPDELAPRRLVWVSGQSLLLEVWRPCRRVGGGFPFAPACASALAASDDGGTTWRLLPNRWWEWSHPYFFNALDGVRVDLRDVWRTRDGGATWQRVFVNAEAPDPFEFADPRFPNYSPWLEPHRVVSSDGRRLWALFRAALYRSDDGGERWARVVLPEWQSRPMPNDFQSAELTQIHFADANHGWIVGAGGLLMSTRDGGNTWRFEDTGTTQRLSAVFGSANNGSVWVGGAHNMIFTRAAGQR